MNQGTDQTHTLPGAGLLISLRQYNLQQEADIACATLLSNATLLSSCASGAMHDRQFWQASYLFARDALLYWLAILTSAGRGYLAILALKCLCSRAPLDLDALVCIVLLIEFLLSQA